MLKEKFLISAGFLAIIMNESGFLRFPGQTVLMNPNDKGKGGGGGPVPAPVPDPNAGIADELAKARKEIQQLRSQIGRNGKGKNGQGQPGNQPADQSLFDKVNQNRANAGKGDQVTKDIESALTFTVGISDFLKTNKDILPAEVEEIVNLANKENYDSSISKANAIKTGMIESFFSVEAHLELLTQSQKTQYEDFKKLTKQGREQKAPHIYEFVFEPALEMIKRVKKAEELAKSRNGFANSSDVESNYRNRLIKNAKKTHLKDKGE